jgi:phosphoglycerate-specific signal transduction histidine kinase
VIGDPTQINQVLLNLCVNARDAMPDGGVLTLRAVNVIVDEQYAVMNRGVAPGRYVAIDVIDNGCGMPREIHDRIFEPTRLPPLGCAGGWRVRRWASTLVWDSARRRRPSIRMRR